MNRTRIAILGVALLIGAAAPVRAQNRAPRWGGTGIGASSERVQPYPYVVYWGPVVVVPAYRYRSAYNPARDQSRGGSWNGSRPGEGGSAPAQTGQRAGSGVSASPGYSTPRGRPTQVAPARPAMPAPGTDLKQHHPQITWP